MLLKNKIERQRQWLEGAVDWKNRFSKELKRTRRPGEPLDSENQKIFDEQKAKGVDVVMTPYGVAERSTAERLKLEQGLEFWDVSCDRAD